MRKGSGFIKVGSGRHGVHMCVCVCVCERERERPARHQSSGQAGDLSFAYCSQTCMKIPSVSIFCPTAASSKSRAEERAKWRQKRSSKYMYLFTTLVYDTVHLYIPCPFVSPVVISFQDQGYREWRFCSQSTKPGSSRAGIALSPRLSANRLPGHLCL